MTSRDFIHSIIVDGRTKPGNVASLHFDGKHIYSYGSHYPLLIKIADKWLVNDRGYSSTTGKHISYARPYADYTSPVSSVDPDEIKHTLKNIIDNLKKDIKELSPRAGKKKETMSERVEELTKTLKFVKSL